MGKYLISTSTSGGTYCAMVSSVFNARRDILEKDPDADIHYACISGGSVPVLFCLLSDSIENSQTFQNLYCEKFDSWWKNGVTYVHKGYYKWIKEQITEEIFNKINGKVHVGVSSITRNGIQFEVVSNFENREHFAQTIIASATAFPFCPQLFRIIRAFGETHFYFDGGLMNITIALPGFDSIYDINVDRMWDKFQPFDIIPSISQERYERLLQLGDRHLNYITKKEPKHTPAPKYKLHMYLALVGLLCLIFLYILYTIFNQFRFLEKV